MGSVYKTDVIELKKIMVERGLDKIIDLSKASGVDRNTLSKIMSGEIQPSSMAMYKLISALNMEPEVAGKIFFTKNLLNT